MNTLISWVTLYPILTFLVALIFLVGHVPIRAFVKPDKTTRFHRFLAAWEAVSIDVGKVLEALGRQSPVLKPLALAAEVADTITEDSSHATTSPAPAEGNSPSIANDNPVAVEAVTPPAPEVTTTPITIEPPPPEPPRAA